MVAEGFTGVIQTTVAKVEAGTRPLKLSEFVGFAHALGMPWQALLAEHEPLLDDEDPLADLENRVAAAQVLEEDALDQLREGIVELTTLYAERRAERTALAREYADLGARPVVDAEAKRDALARQRHSLWQDEVPANAAGARPRDAANAGVER